MNPEFNPDNTTLRQLDGHWQKMALFILWKLAKRDKVKITVEEIQQCMDEFTPGTPVVFTHGHSDSIEFQLIDEASAKLIAELDEAATKARRGEQ